MTASPPTTSELRRDNDDGFSLNIELANIATGQTLERAILPSIRPASVPEESSNPPDEDDLSPVSVSFPFYKKSSLLPKEVEYTLNIVFFYVFLAFTISVTFIDTITKSGGVFSNLKFEYELVRLIMTCIGVVILIFLIVSSSRGRRIGHFDERVHDDPDLAQAGLNFFLRIGLVFFCMGSIILNILRIISPFEVQDDIRCLVFAQPLRLTQAIILIIFITLQAYFIFKYHRRKFRMHAKLVRLGLIHLISVNLGLWLRTVILEGSELFEQVEKTANHTTHIHQNGDENCDRIPLAAKTAQSYLFPCVIQYALLSAGVFANMYNRVEGEDDEPDPFRKRKSIANKITREVSTHNAELVIRTSKKHTYSLRNLIIPRTNACDKAHTGFFVGIFGATVYVLQTILQKLRHWFETPDNVMEIQIVFFSFDGFFHVMTLILIIVLFIRMTSQLKSHDGLLMFVDRSLMHVTFFAQLIFLIFLIIANIREIRNGNLSEALSLSRHLIHFFLYCTQTVFILSTINTRAITEDQIRWKPGRTLLTILIFANLVYWLEESLLFSRHVTQAKYINFYGTLTWCLIVSTCKPLVVFYKFHSASMLAEMWVNVYEYCVVDLELRDDGSSING